jgi:hypothetical protein
MSVQDRIDDATHLFKAGRYPGAMAMMCVAVAGASRMAFPKATTRSIDEPKRMMGDGEAFQRYLSPRIAHLLYKTPWPRNTKVSGLLINFRGGLYDFSHILYTWYRCELIHDARLPDDVRLSAAKSNPGVFSLTLTTGPYIEINADFIASMAAAALLDPHIGVAPPVLRTVFVKKTEKSMYEWEKDLRNTVQFLTGATLDPLMKFFVSKPQEWHDSADDDAVSKGFSEFIRGGGYDRMQDFDLPSSPMFVNRSNFELRPAALQVYRSLRDHFRLESKLVDL